MTDRDHASDDETSVYDIESRGVEYHPPSNASSVNLLRENATDQTPATRLLSCRVDALYIGYRVTELTKQAAQTLSLRRSDAESLGQAALVIGEFSFTLKATEGNGLVYFENCDFRGTYNPKGPHGWTLQIEAQVALLATAELPDVIAHAERVARTFGAFSEKPRLRRFDLAADFAGFPLLASDFASIHTTRSRVVEHRLESSCGARDLDSPALRTHRGASTDITGFNVSLKNPISMRIYDKTRELASCGNIAKAMIEYPAWRAAGWSEPQQVTRVEFQHRGEFVDQIGLRDPSMLPERTDEVWQYDVTWARLIVPDSATRRHRCKVDPRWLVVQKTVFRHSTVPIERQSLTRGGVSIGQLLGAIRSYLASNGHISMLGSIVIDGREVLDEQGYIEALSDTQAKEWVYGYLAKLGDLAVAACAAELSSKLGWQSAVFALLTQNNAVAARFSRSEAPARR